MKTLPVVMLAILLACCGATAQKVTGRSNTGTFEPKTAPDRTPPTIEVLEPVAVSTRGFALSYDSAAFRTLLSSVTVKGLARDSSGIAIVTVNGLEARLTNTREGTEFLSNTLLVLGENALEIKAYDRYRNEAAVRFLIRRDPEKPVAEPKTPGGLLKGGQRWAVIIGVSEYQNTEIPALRYADRDAQSLYDLAVTPLEGGGLGVPKANTKLLLNKEATSYNVRGALTDFLKATIEEDMVFIFFAGHGAPDPDRPNILYLLTYESDMTKLAATAVKMKEVQDALSDYIAAKNVLIFADACHSRGVGQSAGTRGLAPADLVNQFLADLGRSRSSTLTLSASDINQLSQEDKRWGGGHGAFSYHLVEGLKGRADTDRDGIVRLGELVYYVSDNVRRDTKAQQSPIASGSWDINLPLTITK